MTRAAKKKCDDRVVRELGSRELGCRYVPDGPRARSVTVTIKARDAEHAFKWFSGFYLRDLAPGGIQIVDEQGNVLLKRDWRG